MKDRLKGTNFDWPVFSISGGLLLLFVIISIFNIELISQFVASSFALSTKYFGAFWQVLMLLTFIISLGIAFSRYGRLRIGKLEKPEFSTFKWISIIMCTLLAAGGVFWAAAEPIYHFTDVPPIYEAEAGGRDAVAPALAQSYMHWGFLAWTILGSLTALVLMYAHYHRGAPLKPRTILYPIFGEKIMKNSVLGTLVDAFCLIAIVAGTIGPVGFLGLQSSYGLNVLYGIPDGFGTQLAIIIILIIAIAISAITGIHRGIQLLSRVNVLIVCILMGIILIIGPGGFIVDSYLGSMGVYVQNFVEMSTFRGDLAWLDWWTVFFWGWFIGYGPLMAIFISRISRGRTIREIIVAISIVAPLVTAFWFAILGGTGIFYEKQSPGIISGPLFEHGLEAATFATIQALPLTALLAPIFLILTIIFVVTTGDSMSYTMSVAVTGQNDPAPAIRVFWAVMIGAIAAILLYIGEGGISAIQSFIVVTAVPVSLLLIPVLWLAPKAVKALGKEQGLTK